MRTKTDQQAEESTRSAEARQRQAVREHFKQRDKSLTWHFKLGELLVQIRPPSVYRKRRETWYRKPLGARLRRAA